MCSRKLVVSLALAVQAGMALAIAHVPGKTLPTPPVPGKSLPAIKPTNRLIRSFPDHGIELIYLRAESSEQATVRTVPGRRIITVSGVPEGNARGYHPVDPNWKETPASEWGLDFVAQRYGSALVISSRNEIRYIHHDYHVADMVIEVPSGVQVIRESRQPTGEGNPDLSKPALKKH